MKTLRFFFTTMFLLLLFGILGAQDKKTTETYTWDWDGFMPCANENIVGVESCVVTTWEGRYQCRYQGTYTGSTSGKSYSMSALENQSYKESKASNNTFVFKGVLKCEGVPIAKGDFKFHITVNAKGEVTVEKEQGLYWEWICM